MRISVFATVAALAIVALTACSAPATESSHPEPSAIRESTPAPTFTRAPIAAPPECTNQESSVLADASAIGVAGAAAALPDGVVMEPGIQIIPSVKDPGRVEVVARICSSGIDRETLVDAGNSIARAIYADPSHDTVTLLMVSSWVPSGQYLDQQPNLDVIQTDYELFLWDADESTLASNWG